MNDSARVLVVDDEPSILRALTGALTSRGYIVQRAMTARQALEVMTGDPPNIVLLDLGLPDMDGVDVCRQIRTWSNVPIIVLSADGDEHRKVLALDEGANDYVTKPYSTPELLARVRSALRSVAAVQSVSDDGVLAVGDVVVDIPHRTVHVSERAIDLTPKEFAFLALLARHPGRVLTHRMILQEVWGPKYGTETQYLRVYAGQLRKKLHDDISNPRLVTELGVGYRLIERAEPSPA
jgi:two-component system, OmpR family, KDP operon response regulator KdpE